MGFATVDYSGAPDTGIRLIDSLVWGSRWVSTPTPENKTKITVGYYPTVDTFNAAGTATGASRALSAAELQALQNTMDEYERCLAVEFDFIGADPNEQSDIQIIVINDYSSTNLGQAAPPGEQGRDGGVGNFGFSEMFVYANNYAKTGGALGYGGYDYITFVHEFGHAMGLAHPHDDGGTSNFDGSALDWSLIFPGVTSPFNDYGDFNLNQGIYTTMSYNDGFPSEFKNASKTFGYQSGLMALDIMALQSIYGINWQHASGNDFYSLPTANIDGTFFSCIWDGGGIDTIKLDTRKACTIDLRAATGLVEEGGGGFLSSVKGVMGGFTIAHGAMIENATGGDGVDRLIGNDENNVLTGNGGRDRFTGNAGADEFVFKALSHSGNHAGYADTITDFVVGEDHINLVGLDVDTGMEGPQIMAFTFIGSGPFTAQGQISIRYDAGRGRTLVSFNTDNDRGAEMIISLVGDIALTQDDFIF